MKFRDHPLLSAFALLVALALALAAALLVFEWTIRVDGLRGRVEAALGRALGGEAHIDGPLRLITGWRPGIEVEGLRLAGAAGDAKWTAETREARLRLDFPALLRREIVVAAADLRDARLCATTESQARKPRAPRGESGWRVGGIERLRIERVEFFAGPSCAGEPWARIGSLEASLPAQAPLRIEASGALKGASWRAELRGPPFATLAASSAASRFALSANVAGTRLRAQIEATPSPFAASAQLEVDADELLPLTQLFDAPLKGFGPLHARARVEANTSRLELRVDEARLPPAAIAGTFSLDWSDVRPRAALELRGDALDAAGLRQWLDASLDRARLKPGRLMRRIMGAVRASDGALSVQLARLDAGPVALEAVGAQGGWADGVLRAQLAARYGKSALGGSLEADMRGDELAVALEARARAVALPKGVGATGLIGRVDAKLAARAVPGTDWRRALRGTLGLRDARLELPLAGVSTLSIALSDAQVEWLAGDTLRAHAKGSARGEKFETRLEGPGADALFEARPWHASASATFGSLRAQGRGKLSVRDRRVTADLDVTAGAASLAGLPLEARGHVRLGESDWRVELASLRLGQTRGRATLAGALPPTKRPIAAHAEFELLDLAQLAQQDPKADSRLWERELLPRGVRLPDADVEIDAARVTLPRRATLGLSARAQLRGGRMSADLEARDISVPQFGATAGRVRLQASASGATLAALAGAATLKLEARDARIAAQLEGAAPEASIAEANLSAAPGERTRANVVGSALGLPLALQASAAPLSTLLPAGGGEIDVSGHLGEVVMEVAWEKTAPMHLRIDAPRLNAFDALLARRLPQAGPVTLEATLHGLGAPQRSAEVALAVGESRLSGRIADARAQGRHSIDIALQSSLLRLEDVGFHQSTGRTERALGGSAKEAEAQLGRQVERAEAQVVALRRALREIEGHLQLSVARVTSGDSDLGRAEVVATLEDGRLRVAPFKLDAPKGKLSLALDADLSQEEPRYRLDGELDQFQYGALLQSIDATREGEGSLSLKLALAAHGRLDALASSLDGTADFTVFPTAYRSHALDLWGGGLIRTMGLALDREKGAHVNCAVAAFNVSGGVAKSVALMLDSTSMRAAGELEINLLDHRLKGFMAPKPKSPRLVSPLVPVGIGGTLEQPKVGVDVAGVPLAAVRTFYFVPTYLYDAFFSDRMPADGSADCIKAYRRISTK